MAAALWKLVFEKTNHFPPLTSLYNFSNKLESILDFRKCSLTLKLFVWWPGDYLNSPQQRESMLEWRKGSSSFCPLTTLPCSTSVLSCTLTFMSPQSNLLEEHRLCWCCHERGGEDVFNGSGFNRHLSAAFSFIKPRDLSHLDLGVYLCYLFWLKNKAFLILNFCSLRMSYLALAISSSSKLCWKHPGRS